MPACVFIRSFKPSVQRLMGAGMLFAALAAPFGCDAGGRAGPRKALAGPAKSETPSPGRIARLTPMETIRLLRDYRDRGQYSKIEPFIASTQRTAVIAQFRAVERLIAATRLLQNRVKEHLGTAAGQSFARYAQVGNIIGVFSRDVTLLNEQVDGHRARVTFQVADRLPLDSVSMTRERDRWVVNAEPIDGVPEQLLKLAFMLERFAERVVSERLTQDELHREIDLRQSGVMRRLRKLVSQASSAHDSDAS